MNEEISKPTNELTQTVVEQYADLSEFPTTITELSIQTLQVELDGETFTLDITEFHKQQHRAAHGATGFTIISGFNSEINKSETQDSGRKFVFPESRNEQQNAA